MHYVRAAHAAFAFTISFAAAAALDGTPSTTPTHSLRTAASHPKHPTNSSSPRRRHLYQAHGKWRALRRTRAPEDAAPGPPHAAQPQKVASRYVLSQRSVIIMWHHNAGLHHFFALNASTLRDSASSRSTSPPTLFLIFLRPVPVRVTSYCLPPLSFSIKKYLQRM